MHFQGEAIAPPLPMPGGAHGKTYSSLLTYLRTAVVSKTERVVASQVCNVVNSTNGYDYDTAVSLFSYCRSRNGDKEPL